MPSHTVHRTAEEWAELLRTRLLHPAEFAGIAVDPHTIGWTALPAAQLPANPAQLEAFLEQLAATRQVVAGILAADESHPIRIVIRHEAKPASQVQAPRRRQRRPTQQQKVPAPAAPSPKH